MQALITGAGGFVGQHLARHLKLEHGWDVLGLEARPGRTGDGLQSIVCDLRDEDHTRRVIAHYRPEIIFHLAAQTYVPKAFVSPAETLVNNTLAQVNLLEACRRAALDPVILIVGSAEEYGQIEPDEIPVGEDQPFRPTNPYAVSKVTQDLLGLQYYLSYEMKIVRVRPFNHIGPGQSDRFALSSFARQIAQAEAKRSEPVILVGNLDAERDFLDVRDVVRAYALLASPAFAGQVFNVASGTAHSIGSLLDQLIARARVPMETHPDPARMRPVDVPRVIGDAGRLRNATGWAPAIPIEESLRDVLDYWRQEFGLASSG